MRVLDLFSGIGAYSLGLERTGGFETVALCEINAFCRQILKQHWPHVETLEDVRSVTGAGLRAAGIVPNWIVAGWPCQGNSPAGTGLGLDDPRSGLWSEIRRLAGEIRPEGLLLENSSNLLNINGGADFGTVLGDLAALGFDAEWHCLSAAAFDAPHIRDRVWIIATANADRQRAQVPASGQQPAIELADLAGQAGAPAYAQGLGCEPCRAEPEGIEGRPLADGDDPPAYAHRIAPIGTAIARAERVSWEPEPGLVRAIHGPPHWLQRTLGRGMNEAQSRRAAEALRALWSDHVAQALWPAARGLGRIQQAEVLFAFVREYENGSDAARLLVAGQKAPEDFLRGLRQRGIARRPSYGSGHHEQRAGEHSDPLCAVSRLLACDGEAPWPDDSWQDATPAVTLGMPNRVERVHALGNLNPPIIPETIGRAILQVRAAA